jgi:flagellar biosynthesis component FlhA
VSSTLAGVFGIAALFVAVLALVFAIQALRAQRDPDTQSQPPEAEPQLESSAPEAKQGTVKSELRRLSKELDATKLELTETLQHLAVVRYDAYGEMSGRLSWSMALVNDNGNGVVLTSINSRNDARSYAKEVKGFASESKLSPEEAEAIETLRVKASPALGDPDQQ